MAGPAAVKQGVDPCPPFFSTDRSHKGRQLAGEAHEQGFQGVLSQHGQGEIHRLGRGGGSCYRLSRDGVHSAIDDQEIA